jgi:hypothetical protein
LITYYSRDSRSMIDEILVEEIKAKIEELTPTDEGIY